MTCDECGGTGSVPAQGGEPPEVVDNGHVGCLTCSDWREAERQWIEASSHPSYWRNV